MRKIKTKLVCYIILSIIGSIYMPQVFAQEQYNHIWTAESPVPESNSLYGYHVEIDGDYVIISEPYASLGDIRLSGKVYRYDLDGNLLHTFQSPNPESSISFGENIVMYEDLVAIFEVAKVNELKCAGTIHVYKTDGTHQYTIQSQELKSSAISARGISVAFGAEILLISEKGDDMTPPMQGKVYIYSQNGEFLKTILSPEPIVQGNFGKTLEVVEDLILIGQYGNPDGGGLRQGPGYVYVYDYDGNHLMTLEAPEKEEHACFGYSVSISGDKIVIGEYKATVNGLSQAGKVHIFNNEGEHLRTLLSPYPDAYAWFGTDVAISGDIIVVGEEQGEISPFGEEGRAYVFNIDGTLLQNLTAPHPSKSGAYGSDVEIQNDIIVVSESSAEVNGLSSSGRLHVYKLGAPVETHESVEEGTTVVSETGSDSEPSGGIPSYPGLSIGAAILLISLILSRKQNNRSFSVQHLG